MFTCSTFAFLLPIRCLEGALLFDCKTPPSPNSIGSRTLEKRNILFYCLKVEILAVLLIFVIHTNAFKVTLRSFPGGRGPFGELHTIVLILRKHKREAPKRNQDKVYFLTGSNFEQLFSACLPLRAKKTETKETETEILQWQYILSGPPKGDTEPLSLVCSCPIK